MQVAKKRGCLDQGIDAESTEVSASSRDSVVRRIGAWSRRQTARALVRRGLDLHVTGLDDVPQSGPVILVARHYHHLYDAAAILASLEREVHVVIAVDWLPRGWRLALMRRLAGAARWPMVWRRGTGWSFNREGYQASLELLREGRLLLIFPEGYPNVDPRGALKTDSDQFLPFDPGFLLLAERARCDVRLVPVGLAYAKRAAGGWCVCLRFGAPIQHDARRRADRQGVLASLDCAVRELSAAPG